MRLTWSDDLVAKGVHTQKPSTPPTRRCFGTTGKAPYDSPQRVITNRQAARSRGIAPDVRGAGWQNAVRDSIDCWIGPRHSIPGAQRRRFAILLHDNGELQTRFKMPPLVVEPDGCWDHLLMMAMIT
jgi:hypothetical protein